MVESCCCGFTCTVSALVCATGFDPPSQLGPVNSLDGSNDVFWPRLTCGFAVLGLAQVAQGTFVVAEVIEGDPCPVHGLEVVPLVAQHLQAVLLHSLIVDQL